MKILILLLLLPIGAAAQTMEKGIWEMYSSNDKLDTLPRKDTSCIMWPQSFGSRSGDVNLYLPTKREKRLSRLEMIIAIPFVTFVLIAVGSQYGKSVSP